MEFLLLLHGDEAGWERAGEQERAATYAEHQAFLQALADAGVKIVGGAELTHSRTACVVRGHGADAVVTDGPFSEAREQLAGFYTIDVPSRAEAVEWARRLPSDTVEVRAAVES
jgi:hypothetical protein